MFLTIDSRNRENYENTLSSDIRIVFQDPVEFSKISLVFMDLPIDEDSSGNNDESCYFMRIEELPKNIISSQFSDQASFILVKRSPVNYRSMSFENETFMQTIDLGSKQRFSEFNIRLFYRSNAAAQLSLVSDWNAVLRLE